MPKTKTEKSANPAYPDAHPTAPGGMSQKALREELKAYGRFDDDYIDQCSWPQLIDHVIEVRQWKEAEFKAAVDSDMEHNGIDVSTATEDVLYETSGDAVYPTGGDDELDDLDALLAEFEEAAAEVPVREEVEAEADEPAQYGLLIKAPDTLDYIFNGHAGAGPSASERWMHCTASLGASREFLETLTPNQQEQFAVANEAARQGTTAHAAAETEARVILGEMSQAEADFSLMELSIMPDTDGEAYDDEMAEYITEYVDLVRGYVQDRGDDHVMIEQVVEAAVPLTGMHEGEVYVIRGSGDCIVLPTVDDKTLVVGDLKYGNGIDVDVDENPQVRIYALGALGLLVNDDGELITDVENVTYHIVQPRLGGIKTWSEPIEDLLAWRDEVLAPALTAALYGAAEGATFAPSEQACQFCPARGGCAALAEQRIASASQLFDVIVEAEFEDGPGAFPETAALADDHLGALLTQISGLIDIHKDLKAEAERRLYRGGKVPGYQLVNYTPPRKWKDDAPDELNVGYGDDGARLTVKQAEKLWREPTLVTPTQAEKLLGKEDYAKIEDLVDKPDKRPVVAPEGDRRKTWEGRPPEAMFDIEEGDES